MRKDPMAVDGPAETKRIAGFIADLVKEARAKGVVVGISGGVDSAVTGALCVEALGSRRVLGLLMPSRHTPHSDMADARELVKVWGTDSAVVEIDGVVDGFTKATGMEGDRLSRANLQARARMGILYYFANAKGLLVAGTGDRSETELGYFTKWGDGGADFLPIAHLFKTQVRALGAHLGLPERIVDKPASPQLWPGHRATDELPADYEVLDPLLHLLFESRTTPEEAQKATGLSKEVVQKVLAMHSSSEHKRKTPPSLRGRSR